MTEATPATPENAPALDLGRRVFARQARAESRLSPWTRRDLAGKAIVREMRFAQHIARRVYGRGAPGVTFEGPLSPNAPRGVARFSEKVAERNTLADVARKYAPADDAVAGDAAAKSVSNAPMPLAGAGAPGGEGGGSRNAGPAISAAEALQRLAVVRPDLDPDSSPFAKIFKAATGSAQPAESTLQRASSNSTRRVVETFQRGGPRPRADSAPAAPIQPRTERPPAAIQRRADPSAATPAAPAPPAVTPAPERPPATPSSRALRRFTKVEEVVPLNFTPPADDFGDDLPEPGGPALQRALPPVSGEGMPLARRSEAAQTSTQGPPSLAQARRSAQPAVPAPKRPAGPAPAPARLQRRALPVAQAGAPIARPRAQVDLNVEAPALPQRPAEPAARAVDGPSERPSSAVHRRPDAAPAAPPIAGDQPSARKTPIPQVPELPVQSPPSATASDPGDVGAPPRAPIQRDTAEASSGDLPLARPARPESAPGDVAQRASAGAETPAPKPVPAPRGPSAAPGDDAPRPRPTARAEDAALGGLAQPKPIEPSNGPSLQDAASGDLPAAPIQRAPSAGQTAELPIARPELPPTKRRPEDGPEPAPLEAPLPPIQRQTADMPPAPIQRQTVEDQTTDLPLARPAVTPIQRETTEDPAKDLPLARPPEPPAVPPLVPVQRQANAGHRADVPPEPPPVPPAAPIQRQSPAGQAVRPPEPPATPPASAIQRHALEDAATELPRVRPPDAPPTPPAAQIQRPPAQDEAVDLPLARAQAPESPPALIQRQPDTGQTIDLPPARTPEAPPASPILRQPSDGPTILPLVRPPTPEAPQPAASEPPIQSKAPEFPTGKAPTPDEGAETPVRPAAIRPRPSALNLARRAVQRILGEGPQPAAATPGQVEQTLPPAGDVEPRSSPGESPAQIVRREQEPQTDFALRRAPSIPIDAPEPGPGASTGPTVRAETSPGAPRAMSIPARIQRAPAPMSSSLRANRGGEAIMAGPDLVDIRRSFDRDDSLPLVVPLLAAQSQSASRHLQRVETPGPSGQSATRAAPQKTLRRTVESPSVGDSSEPAPKSGLEPAPDQPSPAKGNEPDLNYDLLAQRVYPFIRRLLAFERERERGS